MKKLTILLMIISILCFANPTGAEKDLSLEEEIIYNILVDRFNIGNPKKSEQVDIQDPYAYHGGDLIGITKKLDQIKQHGFTAISISSILENAPKGYHGYWIEDFYNVEEQLGTMEEFKNLIAEAHKRDIKVILELVTNYVALSHPFVNDPEKADWFLPNELELTDSTMWLENVAVLNQDNSEVQDYLLNVAEYWLTETNIDGLKLHAAEQVSESFLVRLAEHVYSIKPETYLLAGLLDTSADTQNLKEILHLQATDNKVMYDAMTDVFAEVERPVSTLFEKWEENSRPVDLLYVDNQNTTRFTSVFSEQGRNKVTAWKLALTYMYTTPGIPSIYQGSELAMHGTGFPENQYLVLFNNNDPDLEEYYGKISALRSTFPVLQHGDFEQVGTNGAMSLFKRTYGNESMYIAINNDSVSRSVSLTDIDSSLQLRGLLGDNTVRENKHGEFVVGIERESAEVYIIEENTGFNWGFIGFVVGVFVLFALFIGYLSYKQKKAKK